MITHGELFTELFAFELLWAVVSAVVICKLDSLKWRLEQIERKLETECGCDAEQ